MPDPVLLGHMITACLTMKNTNHPTLSQIMHMTCIVQPTPPHFVYLGPKSYNGKSTGMIKLILINFKLKDPWIWITTPQKCCHHLFISQIPQMQEKN